MSLWLLFRLVKFLAIALFSAGVMGAVLSPERAWWATRIAGPGWVLSCAAGYGLMRHLGLSLAAPWINGAFLLSFTALCLVSWGSAGTGSAWARWLGLALTVCSYAIMVLRPGVL